MKPDTMKNSECPLIVFDDIGEEEDVNEEEEEGEEDDDDDDDKNKEEEKEIAGLSVGRLTTRQKEKRTQRRRELEARRKKLQQWKKRHDEDVEERLREQLREFKTGLERFALEYREDIRRDAACRRDFYALCARLGVDPVLIGAGRDDKNGTMKMKGEEVYYASLAVAVLDVCSAMWERHGGLAEMHDVVRHVSRRGGALREIQVEDVRECIQKLSLLGNGVGVVQFGGREYVKSVASELSRDGCVLLDVFHRMQGRMTRREAMDELKWSEQRVADGITALAREGMVMVDDPGEGMPRLYWCPAVEYDVSLVL